jgi:hypothetical protein
MNGNLKGKELTANLLILILSILNTGHENRRLVGENQPIGRQVLIPRIQHRIQHRLIQQEIPHPLRDYDVDFRERQLNFLHLSLQEGDLV